MNLSTSPIRVRLAQISQKVGHSYYLPYSVGLLQAYAQQHGAQAERFAFLPPVYRRLTAEEARSAFEDVQIVGFSVYVWNIRRSLYLARAIKAAQPESLIVFGGPQVPDRAEDFLREHSFIDLCTHGAGEELFTQILDDYAQAPEAQGRSHWPALEGVSYLDEQGRFQHRVPAPRTRDLSQHPSPFLSGVFEPLFQENGAWFTAFETNRGCPFSCTFCDWGSAIASKVVRFERERLRAEIEWLGSHRIMSVFCADANFGILKRDIELAQEVADVKRRSGYPLSFQVQAAKNVSERVVQAQSILHRAQLSASAAISLQSLDPHTLHSIKRQNISLEAYQAIQKACQQHNIATYTDIIMGLPGESYDSFVRGVVSILENGQYNKIIFHDATLLPNAEMAQPEYRERFGLKTAEILIPAHTLPADGLPELMEIVVATADQPPEDWVQAHVFAWITLLLFYSHKMFQLALLLLHHQAGLDYRVLLEHFVLGDLEGYPLLKEMRRLFEQSARQLQKGYPESQQDTLVLTPAEGVYLTPDLTYQLQLATEGKVEAFYAEVETCLQELLLGARPDFDLQLWRQTLRLNRQLFVRLLSLQQLPLPPFSQALQAAVPVHYNLKAYFEALIQGAEDIPPLRREAQAQAVAL